jgi:hypothetical protein
MDENHLKAPMITEHFGISEQTIHNWRSMGVPPRRQEHARRLILEWNNRKTGSPLGARLILNPTEDEFRLWNQAALESGQLIEDWAIQGLTNLAEDLHIKAPTYPIELVTENSPTYSTGTSGNQS